MTVFAFNGSQAGVEQLALGDDDHVEPGRNLVTTENLSNQSFSSISLDRATQSFRGGNPEPAHGHPGRQNEQRREAAVNPGAMFVHPLELRAPANVLVRPEAHGFC